MGDTYANDKLFDISACKLGENLTFPYIMLQKRWNDEGNQCHTADVNKASDVDIFLFCEIPVDSLLVDPIRIRHLQICFEDEV